MDKRGINEIVVTVLMVLLLMVAISIVWVFVRNNISSTGERVDIETSFSQMGFSIVESSIVKAERGVSFLLERSAGGDDVDGVVIVIEDDKGNSTSIRKYNSTSMDELQRVFINITSQDHGLTGNITKLYIYPIVDYNGEPVSSDNPVVTKTITEISRPTTPAQSGSGGGSTCGDGIKNATEVCDTVGTTNMTTCTTSGEYPGTQTCNSGCLSYGACTTTLYCGDSLVNGTEQCDDGNIENNDACTNNCRFSVCGDRIQNATEECDDGNTADGDGCSSTCQNEFTQLTACGTLNQSGRTYRLISDITQSATCMNITASNIVLDGNGKKIEGTRLSGTVGVNVSNGLSNITIRNLTVINYLSGIQLNFVNNSIITGNTIYNQTFGLYLVSSNNNNISSNNITNILSRGVYLYSASGSTSNNLIQNNYLCSFSGSAWDVGCLGSGTTNNIGGGNTFNRNNCVGTNVILNTSSC